MGWGGGLWVRGGYRTSERVCGRGGVRLTSNVNSKTVNDLGSGPPPRTPPPGSVPGLSGADPEQSFKKGEGR